MAGRRGAFAANTAARHLVAVSQFAGDADAPQFAPRAILQDESWIYRQQWPRENGRRGSALRSS
jgi:hypothetical protein